jgi:hypothetical protein
MFKRIGVWNPSKLDSADGSLLPNTNLSIRDRIMRGEEIRKIDRTPIMHRVQYCHGEFKGERKIRARSTIRGLRRGFIRIIHGRRAGAGIRRTPEDPDRMK